MQSDEISFIVRGRYEDCHEKCLLQIRLLYPKSPIILSTWFSQLNKYNPLNYDKVVLDHDPENINRQSLASYNGLKICSTPYVCILRPDIYLVKQLPVPKRNKILVSDCYTINPDTPGEKLMYHISDWLYFGENHQLASLFSHAKNYKEYKCRPEQFPILNWINKENWTDDHCYSETIVSNYKNILKMWFEIVNANTDTFFMLKYPFVVADGKHFLREIK